MQRVDRVKMLSDVLEKDGHKFIAHLSRETMAEIYPRFTRIAHDTAMSIGHGSIIGPDGFTITAHIERTLRYMEEVTTVDELVEATELVFHRTTELETLLIREERGTAAAISWWENCKADLKDKYPNVMIPAIRKTAELILA